MDRMPLDPGSDIYKPRWLISRTDRIATAGSCFAQHVGRTLRNAGYNVLDTEPVAPRQLRAKLTPDLMSKYGFGIYSARYGNIYTVRQLLQLIREARGQFSPAEAIWQKNGRFFDAFRPSVEPDGLDSAEDVIAHRQQHLAAVRTLVRRADVFVFTFGLTEAWVHTASDTVYPTAPGTLAGDFDPDVYSFRNFGFNSIYSDFVEVRRILMQRNPDMRFLITVSPVPLTATASGQHVEVATTYSKAVLRAVCGALYEEFDNIDYFPSYEIITSQSARGMYYESNMRNVTPHGVSRAMSAFMHAHGDEAGPVDPDSARKPAATAAPEKRRKKTQETLVCEDALLEVFAR